MITVKELKTKCQKYWDAEYIQRSVLAQDALFPLTIVNIRFTARELSEGFSLIREELRYLRDHSKELKGFGYTLSYKTIQHRQLGRQTIPESILFETLTDFLRFAGLGEAYRTFCDVLQTILNTMPRLSGWLQEHTSTVLEYQAVWPKLLAVTLFLQKHPKPGCYLRELPIPGIDSKFIEQHKIILRDILDEILEPEHIQTDIQGLKHHGFERRYGFKYPEPLIRFRILDPALSTNQVMDMSLPLSEFRALAIPANFIIITENKINGLSFPMMEDAIIIFGLGYGIQSLAGMSWFQGKEVYYWGDIDTHGFAMLSQVRSYYPQVKNLFMDELTLNKFKSMAVEEPADKRCITSLLHLTEKENALYHALCQNTHGKNIRIEQERIDFNYVKQRLQQIFILGA